MTIPEDHVFAIGELVRTNGGDVAHLATCVHGKRAPASSRLPWNYAAGRTLAELRETARTFGVQLCRRCIP